MSRMVGDHSGGNPAKSGNRTFSEGLRSLLSGGKYTSNSKTVVTGGQKYTSNSKTVITGGQTVNIQANQRSIIGTQSVDSEKKGRPQNKLQNDNNNAEKSSTQAVRQVALQSQTERITSTEGAKSVADRRKERSGGSDEVVVAEAATATTLEGGRAVKGKNKSKKTMKKKRAGVSQADKRLSQQVCTPEGFIIQNIIY